MQGGGDARCRLGIQRIKEKKSKRRVLEEIRKIKWRWLALHYCGKSWLAKQTSRVGLEGKGDGKVLPASLRNSVLAHEGS